MHVQYSVTYRHIVRSQAENLKESGTTAKPN
jgi:hypothetical protein